jgi:DNA-binding LacI/PurR family transcriptional regulator
VVAGANEPDFVKPALEQLLRNESRPSAMFAVTQKMTVGALQVVAEAGLVIPKDISFLAFDDCEWFRAMRPFLSTVSQPAEDFADQAWSMLMARLNNDSSPTFHKEVHCTLIVRESTIQYQAPPGGSSFAKRPYVRVSSLEQKGTNAGEQCKIGIM